MSWQGTVDGGAKFVERYKQEYKNSTVSSEPAFFKTQQVDSGMTPDKL